MMFPPKNGPDRCLRILYALCSIGLYALCSIGFFLVATPGQGADGPPVQVVNAFHQTLLTAMKEHPDHFEKRYDLLEPAVKTHFDLERMARITAGRAWKKADEATRMGFIENFTYFTITNYAARFKGDHGQSFTYVDTQEGPRNTHIVKTLFHPGDNQEPIRFDYILRKTDDKWRINDIFLKGSFSELATRKSEYDAIIKRDGFPALVKKIGTLATTIGTKARNQDPGR